MEPLQPCRIDNLGRNPSSGQLFDDECEHPIWHIVDASSLGGGPEECCPVLSWSWSSSSSSRRRLSDPLNNGDWILTILLKPNHFRLSNLLSLETNWRRLTRPHQCDDRTRVS